MSNEWGGAGGSVQPPPTTGELAVCTRQPFYELNRAIAVEYSNPASHKFLELQVRPQPDALWITWRYRIEQKVNRRSRSGLTEE